MKPLLSVVAAIIQNEKGEFLLSSRPEGKPYAGYWEFAGGKVEKGESELDALKRELKEELGLTVHHARIWLTKIHHYEHATVYLRFFRLFADDYSGTPQSKENQQWAWQKAGSYTVSPMLPANESLLKTLALPTDFQGNLQQGFHHEHHHVTPFHALKNNETADHVLFLANELPHQEQERQTLLQRGTQSYWIAVCNQQQFADCCQADVIVWCANSDDSAQSLLFQLQNGTPCPIVAYTNQMLASQYQHQWQEYGLHALVIE